MTMNQLVWVPGRFTMNGPYTIVIPVSGAGATWLMDAVEPSGAPFKEFSREPEILSACPWKISNSY